MPFAISQSWSGNHTCDLYTEGVGTLVLHYLVNLDFHSNRLTAPTRVRIAISPARPGNRPENRVTITSRAINPCESRPNESDIVARRMIVFPRIAALEKQGALQEGGQEELPSRRENSRFSKESDSIRI
jgi:hypothetical protein